ncbi:pectate lyase a [Whalleya microplaca]|nr:pectate lyase a [Whalleya microplaca]
MKFIAALALVAGSATAIPTPTEDGPVDARTIQKRASITDACDVGYCTQNGGTTGGAGGTTTTVSSLAEFTAAAEADDPAVVVVSGAITGSTKVRVGSNKSIIGLPGSSLTGVGLYINKQENVIVRNLQISKVIADNGDAIGIQESSNVWVDHCDLFNDLDHDKDYYDGLTDITHAAEWVTVSNTYFHDHWKGALIGHSDSNGDEDTGHLHVTFANDHFENVNSRGPSIRFGTGHIFNTYYSNMIDSAINSRMGAQILVESSVFEDCSEDAIFFADSDETGYAVVNDVDLGGSANTVPEGTLTSVPYDYTLLGSANVKSAVVGTAGQNLQF